MNQQENQQRQYRESEEESGTDIDASQLPQILQESKTFTLAFIEQLKEKALTPISQQVLDHFHGKIRPNYSIKDIINIIDKRISKMIRNKKIKQNWNFDDIVLLLWFVSKYLAFNQGLTCEKYSNEDWEFISKLIPGSSPKGCMFKFISLKKVKLSSHNWSQKEEDMLRELVKQYGLNNWKDIAEYLYENNPTQKIFRTPKQCREHWNCYLDPNLKKGPWSEAEDLKLLKNVRENKGERKWSSIKHLFEGRTENALKNRYNLLLERQKKLTPDRNESQLIREYLKLKGSSVSTIDGTGNQMSEQEEEMLHPQLPQEIYQEMVQDNNRNMMIHEIGRLDKVPSLLSVQNEGLIKSENSSFRFSQGYEKQQAETQVSRKMEGHRQQGEFGSFMFVVSIELKQSMGGMPSIVANGQRFYTNFVYKPYFPCGGGN